MKPRFPGTPSRRPALRMGAWSSGPPALPTAFPTAFPLLDAGWLVHEDTGFQRRLPSGGNLIREACPGCCQGRRQGVTLGPGQDWMDPPPSQDPGAGVRQLQQPLPQGLGLSWEEPGFPAALRARPGTPHQSHQQAALSHLQAFKNHSCPKATSGTRPQRRVPVKAGQVTVPVGAVGMSVHRTARDSGSSP